MRKRSRRCYFFFSCSTVLSGSLYLVSFFFPLTYISNVFNIIPESFHCFVSRQRNHQKKRKRESDSFMTLIKKISHAV